jgi:hypothetical protein
MMPKERAEQEKAAQTGLDGTAERISELLKKIG